MIFVYNIWETKKYVKIQFEIYQRFIKSQYVSTCSIEQEYLQPLLYGFSSYTKLHMNLNKLSRTIIWALKVDLFKGSNQKILTIIWIRFLCLRIFGIGLFLLLFLLVVLGQIRVLGARLSNHVVRGVATATAERNAEDENTILERVTT